MTIPEQMVGAAKAIVSRLRYAALRDHNGYHTPFAFLATEAANIVEQLIVAAQPLIGVEREDDLTDQMLAVLNDKSTLHDEDAVSYQRERVRGILAEAFNRGTQYSHPASIWKAFRTWQVTAAEQAVGAAAWAAHRQFWLDSYGEETGTAEKIAKETWTPKAQERRQSEMRAALAAAEPYRKFF